jgi:hypothetical protein
LDHYQGGSLDFIDPFKDGLMILQREARQKSGTKFLPRRVWRNIRAKGI